MTAPTRTKAPSKTPTKAPATAAPPETPAEEMAEVDFTTDQWTRMTEALGLAPDADPETIVATIEDLVTTPTDPSTVTAARASAAGLVQVDPGTLASLRADAGQARELRAAAAVRDRTQVVGDAVRAGKIAPARRQHWMTVLAADPGAVETLATLPAGLIPVDGEIGHASEGGAVEPAKWFHA